MKDPYEILKISKNATNEQIKNAYRELARKYHPDNYQNNPLSDLAAEKMKEINEAYELLTNRRGNKNNNSSYQNNYTSSNFVNIRRLIFDGRLAEAEQELNSASDFSRNAEWYFLKGIIMCKKGWLDDGYNLIEKAARMEPSNREYQETLNRLGSQRNGNFRPYGYGNTVGGAPGGCSCFDICLGMMCLDCCCSMR